MKTLFIPIVILITAVIALPGTAGAEWDSTGNPVCTALGQQEYPQVMEDGEGNIIVLWIDYRNGNYDIFVQKIDPYGSMLWTADGVAVCTYAYDQINPNMTADGEGGAIICWQDYRNTIDTDIYAQRVRSDGTPDWTNNGVAICSKEEYQESPSIASDGAGGAIIAWRDIRAGNYDIYAQRVNGNGAPQWLTDGEEVCTDAASQLGPKICEDEYGGAIVAWIDNRNGNFDIFAQRINSSGYTSWTSGGVEVCAAAQQQFVRGIVTDGIGGCIIVWEDFRSTNCDVYAQRVYSSGNTAWTTDGIAVCAASFDQYSINIVPDGTGGAAMVWEDGRGSGTSIYSQWVDRYGDPYWTVDGAPVCTNFYSQTYPDIVMTEDGCFIYTWTDARRGMNDIWAQKLDASGAVAWDADDVLVSDIPNLTTYPVIASDGIGGAIVVYQFLTGTYDLRAQRIERNGYWGYPSPVISDIRDVPGDQGGSVDLAWHASRIDPWPAAMISRYTLWRAINHPAAMLEAAVGARLITSASELPSSPEGIFIRRETVGAAEYFWTLISTVDAYYMSSYSETVPTLFDSCGAANEYHYFQVIAHTDDPMTFWTSPPDSGYSVDNLAPCIPAMLAGEQQYDPAGLRLSWELNTESDLDCYHVYRGTDESFVPAPGNFVAAPCDTAYLDGTWHWSGGYWYKVAAVDIHGNESEYAVLGPSEVTGDDPLPTPSASYMKQNYPNPFNPQTTIVFGLNEPSHVTLRIYDASGRLVRTLLNERREAQHYEVVWDGRDDRGIQVASGVYFYRIKAGEFIETKKMTLLR